MRIEARISKREHTVIKLGSHLEMIFELVTSSKKKQKKKKKKGVCGRYRFLEC